jgi:transposase-like protein
LARYISAINHRLDEELERFMCRRLEEEYPYVILDARYERIRQEGIISSRAVLVAIGVDWEGRRQVLGVELDRV